MRSEAESSGECWNSGTRNSSSLEKYCAPKDPWVAGYTQLQCTLTPGEPGIWVRPAAGEVGRLIGDTLNFCE